jgi:hypothetical protein
MHPRAVLKGIATASVAGALEQASAGARAAGVLVLPAIGVGERVFQGERAIEGAAAALAR